MAPPIQVAAAVVRRDDGAVLISKRPQGAHQGGLWEFPGGKIEPHESRFMALRRELDEELGLHATGAVPLIRIAHTYPDKAVVLHVLEVTAWRGDAVGREGQAIRWVSPAALADYAFPAANASIISAARLAPILWLLDGDVVAAADLLASVERLLRAGFRFIAIRSGGRRGFPAALVEDAAGLCADNGTGLLLVTATPTTADHAACDILNIAARANGALSPGVLDPGTGYWCGGLNEIEAAQRSGAAFAIFEHSAAACRQQGGRSWCTVRFAAAAAGIPLYAVVRSFQVKDLRRARRTGCQGLACVGPVPSPAALRALHAGWDAVLRSAELGLF